jgi:hypothetical protein
MTQQTHVGCRCGQLQLQLDKSPILTAECHCQSCRTAAAQLQQLPAASEIMEPNGGTAFVLYRKDRVQITRGQELLEAYRLTPSSPTRRIVASCCNTPVFLEFQRGHWLSIYSHLWPEDQRPKIELRTMTSDRTDETPLPNDVPNARYQSLGFMAKLLGAWVAMGFRVPQLELATPANGGQRPV